MEEITFRIKCYSIEDLFKPMDMDHIWAILMQNSYIRKGYNVVHRMGIYDRGFKVITISKPLLTAPNNQPS